MATSMTCAGFAALKSVWKQSFAEDKISQTKISWFLTVAFLVPGLQLKLSVCHTYTSLEGGVQATGITELDEGNTVSSL